MPSLGGMEENQTPSGPVARPEKEEGGPRRQCRQTSPPSGPPEPSAASPSATPSAWQRWPSSSGNILLLRVTSLLFSACLRDCILFKCTMCSREQLNVLAGFAFCCCGEFFLEIYTHKASCALNDTPQALRYFHPARHFCQLRGHGCHEAVPRWRLQRHQSPAGEFPVERCTVAQAYLLSSTHLESSWYSQLISSVSLSHYRWSIT